jgi:hypothetical protein
LVIGGDWLPRSPGGRGADLDAGAPSLFAAGWFDSPQSASSGGLFRYTQTIPAADPSKVVSATVKLANAVGVSATAVTVAGI